VDPDRALFFKPTRPSQVAAFEAAVHDEKFASLPYRLARLHQRARRFARLHDNCRLRQRRHELVALGEEKAVRSEVLCIVAQHRYLADQQMVTGDLLL